MTQPIVIYGCSHIFAIIIIYNRINYSLVTIHVAITELYLVILCSVLSVVENIELSTEHDYQNDVCFVHNNCSVYCR